MKIISSTVDSMIETIKQQEEQLLAEKAASPMRDIHAVDLLAKLCKDSNGNVSCADIRSLALEVVTLMDRCIADVEQSHPGETATWS